MAARPPAFSLPSTINQEGPFYPLLWSVKKDVYGRIFRHEDRETYNVVEALRSTQTRRAHADDENINVAVLIWVNRHPMQLIEELCWQQQFR